MYTIVLMFAFWVYGSYIAAVGDLVLPVLPLRSHLGILRALKGRCRVTAPEGSVETVEMRVTAGHLAPSPSRLTVPRLTARQ